MNLNDSKKEKNWIVAVIALVGISAGIAALPLYTIGLFLEPLQEEFGWSIQDGALGTTFLYSGLFLGAPVLGMLVDRWGARPVILASTIWTTAMLVVLSQAHGDIREFYIIYFLLGLGGAGTTTVTYARIITALFDKSRGLALGVMIAGGSFAAIICAPVIEHWVAENGWRSAYLLEAGWTLIPLMLVWFFYRMPAARVVKVQTKNNREDKEKATFGHALAKIAKEPPFWSLATANYFQAIVVSSVITFIIFVLAEQNVGRSDVGKVISLIGVGALIGRVSGGFFLDRFPANRIAFLLMAVGAVALLALVNGFNPLIAAFVLGICFGSEGDVVAYFVGRFYRLEVFSRAYGIVYAFAILGLATGPLIIRQLKPDSALYSDFLPILCVPALFISAVLFLRLGKFPMLSLQTERPKSSTDA